MSLVSIVHMTGLESHEEAVISFVLFASYLATPLMAFGISAALTYVVSLLSTHFCCRLTKWATRTSYIRRLG